jgi:hypothetical protein
VFWGDTFDLREMAAEINRVLSAQTS